METFALKDACTFNWLFQLGPISTFFFFFLPSSQNADKATRHVPAFQGLSLLQVLEKPYPREHPPAQPAAARHVGLPQMSALPRAGGAGDPRSWRVCQQRRQQCGKHRLPLRHPPPRGLLGSTGAVLLCFFLFFFFFFFPISL